MTNYKEILRMKANGFSMRAIANSLHCNWRTVKTCIQKADEVGIVYPWEGNLTNEQLNELFYPKQHYHNLEYVQPNFLSIDEALKKPNMTLMLLWYRYINDCQATDQKYYKHTQFCELYRRYRMEHSQTIRIDRTPAEVLEIDWAGDSLYLFDPVSEQRYKASLFVAAWAFSGYFYTEAFIDEKVHSWIEGNDHALQFFGGVPIILTPDNAKVAVIKPDRYEPELNKAYQEFAEHYQTVIIPARVRKPRDYHQFEKNPKSTSKYCSTRT